MTKLIKAPATCHKCNVRFISPTAGLVDSRCCKCGGRIFTDGATGDTETLDLMRDEFFRIKNITDNSEIKGLCERAVSGIQQHLPVLEQRDKYQAEVNRLRAENSVLREALEKVRGYGLGCFSCGDCATPLYCLNCANEINKHLTAKELKIQVTLDDKELLIDCNEAGVSHGSDVRAVMPLQQQSYTLLRVVNRTEDEVVTDSCCVRPGEELYTIPPCHGA